MSLDPAILRAMAAAGATTEVIIAAIEAAQQAEQERGARKRANNAERQRRFKAARRAEITQDNDGNALPDVTGVSDVTDPPAPNKSPQTPKINPTPHGCEAPASVPTHEGPIPGHRLPDLAVLIAAVYAGSLAASRDMALNALWHGTPPPAGVADEVWTGFIAHRKAHPKAGKFTPRAYQLLCAKLAAMAEDGHPPGDMLDRAIEHGWITVYPPKDARNDNHAPRPHFRDRPSAWAARPGMDGREPAFLDD